jgi:hypothetical protein
LKILQKFGILTSFFLICSNEIQQGASVNIRGGYDPYIPEGATFVNFGHGMHPQASEHSRSDFAEDWENFTPFIQVLI